ncbi:prolow-density lipoprotein receptor-related protein 1-like isoform X2 [Mizuhopecten yessoensis]|nr:prolow-density lipoprotein receptor-related protein 1-like isoform X2 [Mizuhopecten yessoensis]
MLLYSGLVVILIASVNTEDVFISRSDGIYHVVLRNNAITSSNRVLKSSNGEIIALAIDTHDSLLFWYDSSTGKDGIYKGNVIGDGVTSTTVVVNYPEMYVTGLAVDWVIKHLYWTDSFHSFVTVSDYSGNNRVVAVTSKLMLPRGITVDPINRSLYIGDQGAHQIMKCAMDGLFSCTHISPAVWPNQLFASTRNVSWTDGWSNKFVSCSSELSNCYAIAVNTQRLNNGNMTSLFGMVKTDSGQIVSILNDLITISLRDNSTSERTGVGNTYYIMSTSTTTQPTRQTNPCTNNNMGCSQLCFSDSSDRYRCSCSSLSTTVIATDGKSCSLPSRTTKFLLYAEEGRGQIGLVSTTLKGHTVIAWSPKPRALAYDPLDKMVYFSDTKYQTISKVGLNGSSLAVFLSKENNIGNVEAMTLDLKQRRLYFINRFEWEVNNTTRSMARIEMAGLTTNERVLIRHTEDSISDIEIIHHQTASYLYYSVGDPSPAVYKMSLDGRKRVPLILPGLVNPTRLSSSGETLFVLNNQKLIIWSGAVAVEHNITSQAVSMTGETRNVYLSSGRFSLFKFNRLSERAGDSVSADVDPVDMLYVDTRSSGSTADPGLCSDTNLCKSSSVCIKTDNPDIVRCKCPANKFNTPKDGSRECPEPTKYLLVSDVDGIKMTSFDDVLKNVYTIVPNEDECNHYHGLATDGRRIFFAGYDGKILYTASLKGEDAAVLMVLRNMTVLNLAYHDNTLYWTGHYDCYMYNGSLGGTLQCDNFEGKLGGVFSLDVTPGSSTERQVNTLVADIDDPQGVLADSSFVYWSDQSVVKRLSLRDTSPAAAIFSRTPNVFALQQNKQQTHLFLGGPDITLTLFASENNHSEVVYSGLSDVRGLSVQGSLVFASDWSNRTVIQYDLRTHQTRVVAHTLGRPGQIVAFGLDTSITDKPGKCPKETWCSSVSSVQCQHDVDCVDGFRSKCCLTYVNNVCRRECIPPVAESACNITFDGQPSFTWGYETVTNDKCTACECTMDGRSQCSPVQCPSLVGCGFIIKEPGTCCSVCRDITTCEANPNIVGCPANSIEVPLSTALPDGNPVVPVKVSLQNHRAVKNITAFSCNLQEITNNKKTLMPSFVTWQKEEQNVSLIANDDNGIARCDMIVRILDTTKPVFVSSPNDTIVTVFAEDIHGAPAFWTNPVAYDNSGFPPTITTNNRTNGALLPPGFHEVRYKALDRAANSESIKFYVNVSLIPDLTCSSPPFFNHGAMECSKGADDVISCTAKCHKGFTFKSEFNEKHSCVKGQWKPAFQPHFSSACFAPQPTILKLSTSNKIDCKGKQITADDIVECLRTRMPCNRENILLCEKEAILIERTVSGTTVNVQVSGKVPYISDNPEPPLDEMNRTLSTIASGVEQLFSTEELVKFCPSLECSFVQKKGRTFQKTCQKGAVAYNVAGRSICGKCPPGTRFLETNGQSKCEFCVAGKYQDEQAQTDCKMCPSDRRYSKAGIWLKEHCTQSLLPIDPESESLVPIVIGVPAGIFCLILVLVIILFVVKKRKAKKMFVHSHTNPVFNVSGDDYDSIPADQNDPNYSSLIGVKTDTASQYASLGKSTPVKYNKNSGGAAAVECDHNPYDLAGEKNPYDDLKVNNSAAENPYDSTTS